MMGGTTRIGIDDADCIRDMIADPDLKAVWSHCDGDGIDANVDARQRGTGLCIENIDRIGGVLAT